MQIKSTHHAVFQNSPFGTDSPVAWRNSLATVMQKTKRLQLFGLVVLLHVLLIYALVHGLFKQVAHTVPAEVFVTFISAETAAPQPKVSPLKLPVPKIVAISEPAVTPVTESPVIAAPAVVPVSVSAPAEISTPAAPPVAPVAMATVQPKTITSGVEYIRAPRPDYPLASRRMREQGKIVIRVLVNELGIPAQSEIQQSSGSARLDAAARQAVMDALFKPFIDNGKPVTVYALVPIRFQLDH